MYSTCIHCHGDLGRNALIETLTIGRRIAFDEATGRLWVVCPKCARWNLVPFESRWEAIEAGEKLYRDSSQRMSTGEIGLAKTREGTELVRIGRPLRPEMAAWRYGAQLVKRRWTYAKTMIPVSIALGLIQNPGLIPGAYGFLPIGTTLVGPYLYHVILRRLAAKTHARFDTDGGTAWVTSDTVAKARLSQRPGGSTDLWLPIVRQRIEDVGIVDQVMAPLRSLLNVLSARGALARSPRVDGPTHYTLLQNEDATAALRLMLPVLNQAGASSRLVSSATVILTDAAPTISAVAFQNHAESEEAGRSSLGLIAPPRRLALEMLVHEDSERRWLASELLDLEAEWRRANEIAEISDTLLRDPAVEEKLASLRAESSRDSAHQSY
jgi:hypothetical protein